MGRTPELEPVMTLHVELAPPLEIGDIGEGIRRVIPIIGGTFEGAAIRGQVLAGGADWNLARPDGTAELWARYTLRTDDAVLIGVLNTGVAVPQAGGSVYVRTVPRFEVGGERYAWLRQSIFVGTLTAVETGNAVHLQFFRVT
ncbi:MAG TPA: DUF3237 domain-containing protein [Herpetosiphonaceae bacterium]|nr:DUF3237 domain-containing protein [Herpetosiphonaceae bacterium]